MRAAYVDHFDDAQPLAGLVVGDRPMPEPPDGWELVHVVAASLNHHDLWSLRGVGLREDQLPRVLGTDAAGRTSSGREVIVHAVIGDPDAGGGDETFDPGRTLLSEAVDGTLAEVVAVPARNLVDKPSWLSFEAAACLPTAWLTAYRMLFRSASVSPGDAVLVQGAGGGVATAAIVLAAAAGLRVYATSRDPGRRARAVDLGATSAVAPGERLPERVDAVIETVGGPTWAHSVRSLRPGGTLVCAGATAGSDPPAELQHVFFRQLRIVGSTMGNRGELEALVRFMHTAGIEPVIDDVVTLDGVDRVLGRLYRGECFGKLVVRLDGGSG